MRILKRITHKSFILITTAIIAAALLFGALAFNMFASAADEIKDTSEFQATSLEISNPGFNQTSGSFDPTASPTSWSGAVLGNGSDKELITGVVDLTPSNYLTEKGGNKNLHLDQYPEYSTESSIPKTIFGSGTKYGGDQKTLIINTPEEAEVIYSYSSSEMTFAANSFYRVSAWVKTGNFDTDSGATIKLTGLGVNCAFININTVKDIPTGADGAAILTPENKYGWVEYEFYVRTSASFSKTVKLSLGIGDAVSSDEKGPITELPHSAHGYAFFDTVSATRISAYDYAFKTSQFVATERENVYKSGNGTSMSIDLYDADYLTTTVDDVKTEIGSFSNADLSDGTWDPNIYYDDPDTDSDDDLAYVKSANVEIYDSQSRITDFDDKTVHLTQNPWSTWGRAEYDVQNDAFVGGTNGNILMISANDGAATRGVASPDVTIERFKYYRFSVWVKGDGISGGDGITVRVKGQKSDPSADNKLAQAYTSLEGDSSDTAHYGWKEQVVYIIGSTRTDLTVHFEFWLGSPANPSSGIAMFDNVTFTELSQAEYSERSTADGGNVLSLDATSTSSTIANGDFTVIGEYDVLDYPLPVSDWTYYDAETVTVNGGFSHDSVNTDSVIRGIIPADKNAYDKLHASGKLGSLNDPTSFADPPSYNALVISSTDKTAVCYRSSNVTAAVDKGYKLTVDMAVDGVSADSYGASLVLKSSENNVLSTIEGIKTTDGAYKTFTFYIDAPLKEHSVYVEIWLGLNDRFNNTQKLSDGNIYVKKVSMDEWTVEEGSSVADEYAELYDSYKAATSSPAKLQSLDYGLVSFNSPAFDYFDAYSYVLNDGYGVPYNWSMKTDIDGAVKSGLFDTNNIKDIVPYPGFDKKDQSGKMLLIYNTEKNRTVYTFDNTVTLVANTYYRLDATIKVNVSDEVRKDKTSIGAGLNLTGTVTKSFENIKDTTKLVSAGHEDSRDYEMFRTYSFYISSGSNGGDVGFNISFGGTDPENYIQGKLIVSNVSLTSITASDYESAKDRKSSYEKTVALSETTKDKDDSNVEQTESDIAWWIIPTIIFSVCLLAAIAIIIVLRIRDRFKKKKKATYTTEYDRSAVAKELDKLAAGNDEEKPHSDEEYSDTDDGSTETAEKDENADETGDTPAEQNDDDTEKTDEEKSEADEAKDTDDEEEKPTKVEKEQKSSADDLDD